eukprot:jgi/Astpho2/1769/fgenesh1_pg.00033_%23_2_t
MDLGPETRYKDVRCVKYERSASKHLKRNHSYVDLWAFAMQMVSAASREKRAAHQPLPPVQLSPGAPRQADALLATSRPRVHVNNAFRRKQRRSAARRRADLDDHSGGYDAWKYPPDALQDSHQKQRGPHSALPCPDSSLPLRQQKQALHLFCWCCSCSRLLMAPTRGLR